MSFTAFNAVGSNNQLLVSLVDYRTLLVNQGISINELLRGISIQLTLSIIQCLCHGNIELFGRIKGSFNVAAIVHINSYGPCINAALGVCKCATVDLQVLSVYLALGIIEMLRGFNIGLTIGNDRAFIVIQTLFNFNLSRGKFSCALFSDILFNHTLFNHTLVVRITMIVIICTLG